MKKSDRNTSFSCVFVTTAEKEVFFMFLKSTKEFKDIRALTVTGMFIAVSMVIEKFSINLEFAKINFAFLAIAVIGMLTGPAMGFAAGMICDIVGFLANPTSAFLPVYTLVAGIQGLIYGVCLYRKQEYFQLFGLNEHASLMVRAVIARLLDVAVINLCMNTWLNMHYGFIPKQAFHMAVYTRLAKNLIELLFDIPMLCVLLPAVLLAYRRAFRNNAV